MNNRIDLFIPHPSSLIPSTAGESTANVPGRQRISDGRLPNAEGCISINNMKRLFCLLILTGLLLAVRDGQGEPLQPFTVEAPEARPLSSIFYTLEFRGGKPATVAVLGNGTTYLGVYVYDAQGNCVVWDDEGNALTGDKLAVNWKPWENAFYLIEVRNAGSVKNKCRVFVR